MLYKRGCAAQEGEVLGSDEDAPPAAPRRLESRPTRTSTSFGLEERRFISEASRKIACLLSANAFQGPSR